MAKSTLRLTESRASFQGTTVCRSNAAKSDWTTSCPPSFWTLASRWMGDPLSHSNSC